MVNPGLPIGAVVAFVAPLSEQVVGMLAAQGWLVCDGRSLDAPRYPELFSVLQYVYGGADDSFNLPLVPAQKCGPGQLTQIIKAYTVMTELPH
jgi:microcystin-dependent protein